MFSTCRRGRGLRAAAGGRAASATPGEEGCPRQQAEPQDFSGASPGRAAALVRLQGPERGRRGCRHPPPRGRTGLVPPQGGRGPAGPAAARRAPRRLGRPGHGANAPSSPRQQAGGEVSKAGGRHSKEERRQGSRLWRKRPQRYGLVKRQRPFARHCNCKMVTRTGSTSSCGCCPLSDAGRGPVSIVQQQLPSAGAPSASVPATEWSKQGGTREGHPGGRGVPHD